VQRGYDVAAQRTPRQEFAICAYAGLLGTAALVVFMFMAKMEGVSRLLIGGCWLTGTSFLWLERTFLLPLAQRRGRQPIRNLLVIGNQAAAQRFAEILSTPAYHGSRLVGFVSDDRTDEKVGVTLLPRVGGLADLETILDRDVVDEVVLVRSHADSFTSDLNETTEEAAARKWGNILELCLERGRTVSLVDDMVPPVGAKVEATMMGSLPTLVLHNTPQNTLALAIKILMDRIVALFTLIVLAPLFAIIALAIKITSPGPIFFVQQRVGLNGRTFKFYKFRSMAVNAEEILEKMKREEPEKYRAINIMDEPFFKAKEGDDPRITSVGRILRKTSLDELPQFWNVLRGDMSLVGPRPPLPKEVEQLEAWQRRKLSVKGGLTFLWQVSGRNEINTDEWMRLDLEYIDNWSLWLDMKLIFKTLKVLIKPKGAS
jgi:exopolysaccharide biosynthesis polyprenyl glycosylphosphotransferase